MLTGIQAKMKSVGIKCECIFTTAIKKRVRHQYIYYPLTSGSGRAKSARKTERAKAKEKGKAKRNGSTNRFRYVLQKQI